MPEDDIPFHHDAVSGGMRPADGPMDAPTRPLDLPTEPRSTEQSPLDRVIALTYQELRAIAHRRLAARGPTGTLSTTALVHEVYLKLVDHSRVGWQDLAHFRALASLAMRHILVDRARERSTHKRGGVRRPVTLDEGSMAVEDQAEALLQLNDALERLAMVDPRLAQVVDCRFFGGLTEQETAEALELTTRTVQRDWVKARVLLRRLLET
jgi:RNA polymerase sigma factor (TIGR02999 family)